MGSLLGNRGAHGARPVPKGNIGSFDMTMLIKMTKQALADRKGVTALEYGMIAGALAVGLIAAFTGLFGAVITRLGTLATAIGG